MLTHLARNADAMINLLMWARTGIVTPAYASAEARNEAIEKGAVRPPGEIRDDVLAASDRLAQVVRELPEAAWAALVTNVQGRVMRASAIPWTRAKEMWIHSVDLDAGASFADMPSPMMDALLTDAADAMGRKPECPALHLVDGDHRWEVGESGEPVVVTGPAPELAAWLLGRSKGKLLRADGTRKLPVLPRWL